MNMLRNEVPPGGDWRRFDGSRVGDNYRIVQEVPVSQHHGSHVQQSHLGMPPVSRVPTNSFGQADFRGAGLQRHTDSVSAVHDGLRSERHVRYQEDLRLRNYDLNPNVKLEERDVKMYSESALHPQSDLRVSSVTPNLSSSSTATNTSGYNTRADPGPGQSKGEKRSKAFDYLKTWRLKMNMPTDSFMTEKQSVNDFREPQVQGLSNIPSQGGISTNTASQSGIGNKNLNLEVTCMEASPPWKWNANSATNQTNLPAANSVSVSFQENSGRGQGSDAFQPTSYAGSQIMSSAVQPDGGHTVDYQHQRSRVDYQHQRRGVVLSDSAAGYQHQRQGTVPSDSALCVPQVTHAYGTTFSQESTSNWNNPSLTVHNPFPNTGNFTGSSVNLQLVSSVAQQSQVINSELVPVIPFQYQSISHQPAVQYLDRSLSVSEEKALSQQWNKYKESPGHSTRHKRSRSRSPLREKSPRMVGGRHSPESVWRKSSPYPSTREHYEIARRIDRSPDFCIRSPGPSRQRRSPGQRTGVLSPDSVSRRSPGHRHRAVSPLSWDRDRSARHRSVGSPVSVPRRKSPIFYTKERSRSRSRRSFELHANELSPRSARARSPRLGDHHQSRTRSPLPRTKHDRPHSRSPRLYSRHPTSPRVYSRSPRPSAKSPKPYSVSSRNYSVSPRRYSRSPRRSSRYRRHSRSPRPFSGSVRPLSRSPEPLSTSLRPSSRSPGPHSRSPGPLSRSLRPFSRSPRPYSRSPRPLSRSPRQLPRSPGPASRQSRPLPRSPGPTSRRSRPLSSSPRPVARYPRSLSGSPQRFSKLSSEYRGGSSYRGHSKALQDNVRGSPYLEDISLSPRSNLGASPVSLNDDLPVQISPREKSLTLESLQRDCSPVSLGSMGVAEDCTDHAISEHSNPGHITSPRSQSPLPSLHRGCSPMSPDSQSEVHHISYRDERVSEAVYRTKSKWARHSIDRSSVESDSEVSVAGSLHRELSVERSPQLAVDSDHSTEDIDGGPQVKANNTVENDDKEDLRLHLLRLREQKVELKLRKLEEESFETEYKLRELKKKSKK